MCACEREKDITGTTATMATVTASTTSPHHHQSTSIEDKRLWIEHKLESIAASNNKSDLLAIDFEVNLLLCAAHSYKHETVLKPFPSTFLSDSNNNKNYSQLLNALDSLPPVVEWKTKVKKFNSDQLSLVYWLLVHKNYQLVNSTTMNQEKLKEAAKYTENFSNPTHVFEIMYSEEKNKKFESLKQQRLASLSDANDATAAAESVTSINFHGTRMDNVYSILHMGLLGHFSKNALFGEGTYLSQEPSISLHYSPANKTWPRSLIGPRMSCLLVCETINDPDHVKTGVKTTNNSNQSIPEKYFIVKNNDYVRVKYVLVYADKPAAPNRQSSRLTRLLNENRFILLLIAYSLLLMFIGLMNSRAFHKYIKLSYRKLFSLFLGEAASYYD